MSEKKTVIMTVDPGLSTGFAVWEVPSPTNPPVPSMTGIICGSGINNMPWGTKFREQVVAFRTRLGELLMSGIRLQTVWIEWPFFTDNQIPVAERQHGGKLQALIGALITVCNDCSLRVRLLKVSAWKGTMPKAMVIKRIKKTLGDGCLHYRDDVWDAVGMGLYVLTEQNKDGKNECEVIVP